MINHVLKGHELFDNLKKNVSHFLSKYFVIK